MRSQLNCLLLIVLCSMVFHVNCSADMTSIDSTDNIYNNDSSLLRREIILSRHGKYTTHTKIEAITSFVPSTTTKVIEITNISDVPQVISTSTEHTVTSFSAHRTVHRVVVYKTHYRTKPTFHTSTSTITNVNVQTSTETNILTTAITYTTSSIYTFTVTTPYTRTKYSRSRFTSTSKTSSTIYRSKTTSYILGVGTIRTTVDSTEIEYSTKVIGEDENNGNGALTTIIPTKTVIKPYTTIESVVNIYTSRVVHWPQIVESWSLSRSTYSSAYYITRTTEYEDAYYTTVRLSSLSEYTDYKTNTNTFTSYVTSYSVSTGVEVETLLSSRTVKTTETLTRTIKSVTKIPQVFTSWVPHTDIKSLTSVEDITILTILTKTEYIVEELSTHLETSSTVNKTSSITDMISTSKDLTSLTTSNNTQERPDLEEVNSAMSNVQSSLSNTMVNSYNSSITSKTGEKSSNNSSVTYTSTYQTNINSRDSRTHSNHNTSTLTHFPVSSYSKNITTFSSIYQTISNSSRWSTRTVSNNSNTNNSSHENISSSSTNEISLETSTHYNYTDSHITTKEDINSQTYSTMENISSFTESETNDNNTLSIEPSSYHGTSSKQLSFYNKTSSVIKPSFSPPNSETSSVSILSKSTHSASYNSEFSYTIFSISSSGNKSLTILTSSFLSNNMSIGSIIPSRTITTDLHISSDSYINSSMSTITTHHTDQPSSSHLPEFGHSSISSENNSDETTTDRSDSSNEIRTSTSLTHSNTINYATKTTIRNTTTEPSSMSILKPSHHLNITFSSISVVTSSLSTTITAMSNIDALNRTKSKSHHSTPLPIDTDSISALNSIPSDTVSFSRDNSTTNNITPSGTISNSESSLSSSILHIISTYAGISQSPSRIPHITSTNAGISQSSSYKLISTNIATPLTSSISYSRNKTGTLEVSISLISTSPNSVKTSLISSSSTSVESWKDSHIFSSSFLIDGISSKTDSTVPKHPPIQNVTSSIISNTILESHSLLGTRPNTTHSYWVTATSSISEEIDVNIQTDEEEVFVPEYPSTSKRANITTTQFSTYSNANSNVSISEPTSGESNVQGTKSVIHLANTTLSMLTTTDPTIPLLNSTKRSSSKFSLTPATSIPSSESSIVTSFINSSKQNSSITNANTHRSKSTESVNPDSSYSTVKTTANTLSQSTGISETITHASSILATLQIPSSSTNITFISLDRTSRSTKFEASFISAIKSITSINNPSQINTIGNPNKISTASQSLTLSTNTRTLIPTAPSNLSENSSMETAKPELAITISKNLTITSSSETNSQYRTKTKIAEKITLTDEYIKSSGNVIISSTEEKSKSKTTQSSENIDADHLFISIDITKTNVLESPSEKTAYNVDTLFGRTGYSTTESVITTTTGTRHTNDEYSINSKDEIEQSFIIEKSSYVTNSEEMNNENIISIASEDVITKISVSQVVPKMKTIHRTITNEYSIIPFSSSTSTIISRHSLDALQKSLTYHPKSNLGHKTSDRELWKTVSNEDNKYYNIAADASIPGVCKILYSLLMFLVLI